MIKIAVIGDIHKLFSLADVEYFNRSAYSLILLVGDLAGRGHKGALPSARLIAQITKPLVFIPGNHDTVTSLQIAAEATDHPRLARLFSMGQSRRIDLLEEAIYPVPLAGYSIHPFMIDGTEFDVISARPYSIGERIIGSERIIKEQYGVSSIDESSARLCQLVDESGTNNLIFLAHNGPFGLGDEPTDIWGKDFGDKKGDFGDRDLQRTIRYAQESGKNVVAVVAGHMHRRTKDGRQRRWLCVEDNILYINAAEVPRTYHQGRISRRHYMELLLHEEDGGKLIAYARDIWFNDYS